MLSEQTLFIMGTRQNSKWIIDESVKDILTKMDKSIDLDGIKLKKAYEIYEMKLGQYDD